MRNTKFSVIAVILVACLIARWAEAAPVVKIFGVGAQGNQKLIIPDTPAGRQFADWLRIFNDGNVNRMRSFISERFAKAALEESSAVERATGQAMNYYDTRGYTLRRVEQSTNQEITILAQSKLAGLWYRITIKVTAESPYNITKFDRERISRPSDFAPSGTISRAELLGQIENLMQKMVAADVFSGAVLVAKKGKPIFTKAYGMASKRYSYPNRIDTKFDLASLNKMFTAIAIAQLAEQGKLSFDDTIAKLLPDYPNKQVAQKVTVHQLLTHTSGMGSYFGDRLIEQRTKFRTVRDYFPLFVDEPLAFEPGQDWRYSNSGFIVLGAIIEKVSGESYFDYVREHIYKPVGVLNTDSYEMDRDVSNLATGYTNADRNFQFQLKERRNTLIFQGFKGSPAGGGYSTVGDLLRFSTALREHKLLSSKYTEIVMDGKVQSGKPGVMYGYGFEVERVNGERIVGHSGGALGANTFFDMYLDSGYTVIVLSNYDRGGNLVAAKLREMIR